MTKIIQIRTNTAFTFDFNANGTSYRMEIIYNGFSNSYFFNLYRHKNMQLLLSGITLSTGTNLLSQFPQWFRLWVIPTKPELYSENPNAQNIRNFQLWIEDEE